MVGFNTYLCGTRWALSRTNLTALAIRCVLPVITIVNDLAMFRCLRNSATAGSGADLRGGRRDSGHPSHPLWGQGLPMSRSYITLPSRGFGVSKRVPSKSKINSWVMGRVPVQISLALAVAARMPSLSLWDTPTPCFRRGRTIW